MTETARDDPLGAPPARQLLSIVLALGAAAPGTYLRLGDVHLSHPLEALLFGMAIVGAAFLLSWAAEVAQLDISAGLAIAVLAFIAVLPEYAVDLVFAYKAGLAVDQFGPSCVAPGSAVASPCSLALANMTGANRLLIGIGWSMVVFIAWYRSRAFGQPLAEVALERTHSIELAFLTVATAYSLTLPLKSSITLLDAVVLVGIFALYTIRLSTAPAEEPHLVGPARYVGALATGRRRAAVFAMFLVAALVILLVAEPFAEALVATGQTYGVSEFLLVQWLAPLASETPELLVAGMYAWKLNTNAGLGTLVSSKVNQWTLLVGTLPIVFAIAAGTVQGLPIEPRQREEILLTAAQSMFAVAVLASLSLSLREAFGLFSLFWAQFIIAAIVPEAWHGIELIAVSCIYLLLAVYFLVRQRRDMGQVLRDGFRTPHQELAEPTLDATERSRAASR
jgi:cation:H+ antiporter